MGMVPNLDDDLRWRKSSVSGGEGTQCVELHPAGAVRDSKNPAGPHLPVNLDDLLVAVKAGHLTR